MTNLNAVDPAAVAQDAHLESADVVIGKNTIIFRRFMRNKTAVAGLAIFLALTVFSFVGGYFTEWDKQTIDPFNIGMPPSAEHYLGTSQAGIDLYAMTVEGTRISILIGLIVGLVSVLVAAVYGCTMAYFGGKVDKVMLFILEALIMMPALLVVAVATSGGGEGLRRDLPSWLLLIIVLLVFSWMGTARLIRSLSMSLMQRDFVKAAQYMGVPARRIVWRHLVPNIGSLLVLDITRGVTGAILAEVAFSFIGIGIKVPDVSLGVLIGGATSQVQTFPWMFWVPLTVMFLLTGSLAMMNDGLRDAFDPSSSSSGSAKKRIALKARVKGNAS
ncbi:ABC transporter permease [Pseudarthrobacter oxydans]|uniref:Oligopeptide transport system permease protein OppC n=1 Tax=Pseudarthrobacter oxydans TaxID=1671 RepID=A0AAW8NFF7_PSEOX|nr:MULTISPECIES: ABC transporter permease [Pseudarthrobacter]WHP59264.1 ABC transporter permease [Arthrobacter sp. KFRI-F3372]MDR6793511.1 peptide/nickel transport system permease protein [Pseudarthrobacter oxydans]MDR7164673.1 peptide/nickel transport system permease protein [Pseudarthrobacter oxydans]BFE43839.1 ABC transporter permease [Pseudarthrobacter oxydans]GKV73600.1 peptide ABC transporter permease [Pseudarthrobacter sp. NCCP-2145]